MKLPPPPGGRVQRFRSDIALKRQMGVELGPEDALQLTKFDIGKESGNCS